MLTESIGYVINVNLLDIPVMYDSLYYILNCCTRLPSARKQLNALMWCDINLRLCKFTAKNITLKTRPEYGSRGRVCYENCNFQRWTTHSNYRCNLHPQSQYPAWDERLWHARPNLLVSV